MGEVEINIGGIVEARRVNTMERINSEVEYVVQDNNDLENMKLLYEKLHCQNMIGTLQTAFSAACNPGMKWWRNWHIMLECRMHQNF